MKFANRILGLMALVLMVGYLAAAQQQQLSIGENTKLNANGLFTFGYSGDYGDAVPSDHGLNFGGSGEVSGYYYNPNFISFSATPYYNQSRADSSYQSITGASGVTGTANLFSGTHFPGSVSYNYTENSTGTFGLTGQPNFTTYGRGNGFGINWSALVPDLPTLSVGYTQGSGSGTIYGTDQESKSSQRMFNAHSNYQIEGFRLNAFFTHNSFNSEFPEFLAGEQDQFQNSSGHDFGFSAIHALPMRGTFSASYDRASATSNSMANEAANEGTSNSSSYTDDNESASVSFSPTRKFSFNVSQNYVGNLSGYLTQSLSSNGIPQEEVGLGAGSHSVTLGAGANYQFTNFLSSSLQATYYDQFYFGHSYTGEYLAGTVNYNKRLWDMLSFSGSVIDSSNGQGQNALGFIGNANFFRGFGHWADVGPIQLRAERANRAHHLYNFLLPVPGQSDPPFAERAAVDGIVQRKPQWFDERPRQQQQQPGLCDGVERTPTVDQWCLFTVEWSLRAGRGRANRAESDAGIDQFHHLQRVELRRRHYRKSS